MTEPRPIDDLDAFAAAYSTAWTKDPVGLLDFFDPAGSYTDMAMGTTYEGHDGILRFHQWMLKFAPDSVIEFCAPAVRDGVLLSRVAVEWIFRRRAPTGRRLARPVQRTALHRPRRRRLPLRSGRQADQPSRLLGCHPDDRAATFGDLLQMASAQTSSCTTEFRSHDEMSVV